MHRGLAAIAGIALVITLVLVLVALIGSYTFVPGLVEASISASIQDELNLQAPPEVEVESDPQPAILLGRFSGGKVEVRQGVFGGLRTQDVSLDLEPFDVDVLRSLASRSLVYEEDVSGTLRVEVSEEEVERLARLGTDLDKVRLADGELIVEEDPRVFGLEVPLEVSGGVDLRGKDLVFLPRRVSVAGIPLPERAAERVLDNADFSFEIEGLPRGVSVEGASVEGDMLVLDGEIEGVLRDGGEVGSGG